MNARTLSILAVLFLAPAIAGCGDDTPQPPVRAALVPRFQPEQDNRVRTAAAAPPYLSEDPLDQGGNQLAKGDPLDSGGDSLAKGNSLADQDPLSAQGTSNWYWLRGNITGGSIAISVDGVSMGRFTVHMDKEITRMLHPGMNEITFAPVRDNPQVPVQARLEVVYSQMEPGQLPPLVFDTSQAIKTARSSLPAPPPVFKPVVPDGGEAGVSQPAQLPAPPKSLSLTTHEPPTTLTFVAE